MTSNGKQFTVTREMLTAVAGISARYSKFALVLFCYITNHLMTGPLGNSEFCFPRISILGKQNSLFPSGPVIKCLILHEQYYKLVKLIHRRPKLKMLGVIFCFHFYANVQRSVTYGIYCYITTNLTTRKRDSRLLQK